VRAAASALHIPVPVTIIHTWYSEDPHNVQRARLIKQLEREPGQHLVIVRYNPDHEIFEDWVYNSADINSAKVVWARDMGATGNQELIEHFKAHSVWLVEPDETPFRLAPYGMFAHK